jgi:HEAT repeat protein
MLAQVGDKAAQEALQQMGQKVMGLEEAVGELIQQGRWGVVIRALTIERVRKVMVGLGTAAVSVLIEALGDGTESVRAAACEALGQIGVAAMPLLIQAAQNKNLREAVVQVLGKIGVAAVPKLIEALQDRQTYVRTLACTALGVIGDGQAVPALLSTLQDQKAEVRRAAQKALQQIEAKGLTSS